MLYSRHALRALRWLAFAGVVSCGSSGSHPASKPGYDGGTSTVTPSDAAASGYAVCGRLSNAAQCFSCCAAYVPLGQPKLLAAAASCACTAPYCGPLAGADAAGDAVVPAEASADDGATDDGPPLDGDLDATLEASTDGAPVLDGEVVADSAATLDADPGDGAPQEAGADAGFVPVDTGDDSFGQGTCNQAMCSLTSSPSSKCVVCVLELLEGAAGMPLCTAGATACKGDPDCAELYACSANCPGAVPD